MISSNSKMLSLKALIFDFDGVLVNTEEILSFSWTEVLARRGVELDREDLNTLKGRPGPVNSRFILEKYKLSDDPEEFLAERRLISKELSKNKMQLMEGAAELLANAKKWGLKCAIGSSGYRKLINATLAKFGIAHYFEAVVTAEDLVKGEGKPDPEVFLIAAESLGVKPEQCLVLEDAESGVLAAKAAGMKVILLSEGDKNRADEKADLVLKSLRDVTRDVVKSLEKK